MMAKKRTKDVKVKKKKVKTSYPGGKGTTK